MLSYWLVIGRAVILLVGLAYGGYSDLRSREVTDRLWISMGIIGGALLLASDMGGDPRALLVDAVVAFFVLEHFVSWEDYMGEHETLPLIIEAILYVAIPATIIYGYITHPAIFSVSSLIVVISVLIARGLFEARLLYGGADAKALMVAALVMPLTLAPFPLLFSPSTAAGSTLVTYTPVCFNILVDGALLTLLVPIGILIRNLRHGFKEFPEALFLLEIPTQDLPKRFVWLRRPPPEGEEDVETAEEDLALREAEAKRLTELGIDRVLVTPQLPMVTALAFGAVVTLLVGNILFLVL